MQCTIIQSIFQSGGHLKEHDPSKKTLKPKSIDLALLHLMPEPLGLKPKL
jgi:hypothetical protein